MISAKIIADSVSPADKRITTLQLKYPKFVHSEFMTHRVFSRNASSSRAIPFAKFVKDIEEDMAEPIHWGRNESGMQAREEVDEQSAAQAHVTWRNAFGAAHHYASQLAILGVHKQIVNRLLEPFYNINVLCTSTEWDNFFELRDHPDAQPEMRALAVAMKEAMANSTPKELDYGEWHLPYVNKKEDWNNIRKEGMDHNSWEPLIKISVARCARVSYLAQDGKPSTIDKDLALYDRLVGSRPFHASPCEHQARPRVMGIDDQDSFELCGNLVGWIQYRKVLENKEKINKKST